jgi:hypothetical protein
MQQNLILMSFAAACGQPALVPCLESARKQKLMKGGIRIVSMGEAGSQYAILRGSFSVRGYFFIKESSLHPGRPWHSVMHGRPTQDPRDRFPTSSVTGRLIPISRTNPPVLIHQLGDPALQQHQSLSIWLRSNRLQNLETASHCSSHGVMATRISIEACCAVNQRSLILIMIPTVKGGGEGEER